MDWRLVVRSMSGGGLVVYVLIYILSEKSDIAVACPVDTEPCLSDNYKELPNPDNRCPECGQGIGCDKFLDTTSWYRFDTKITTTCPQVSSCGTHYPIWMNGSFPTLYDGIVERQACLATFDSCCDQVSSLRVLVRNCAFFYVYCFTKTPTGCNQRFCFDNYTETQSFPIPTTAVSTATTTVITTQSSIKSTRNTAQSTTGTPTTTHGTTLTTTPTITTSSDKDTSVEGGDCPVIMTECSGTVTIGLVIGLGIALAIFLITIVILVLVIMRKTTPEKDASSAECIGNRTSNTTPNVYVGDDTYTDIRSCSSTVYDEIRKPNDDGLHASVCDNKGVTHQDVDVELDSLEMKEEHTVCLDGSEDAYQYDDTVLDAPSV